MGDPKLANRRNYIRFNPDALDVAFISSGDSKEDFKAERVALIADQSFKGARLVFVHDSGIVKNEEYLLQLGKLPVVRARALWLKKPEGEITVIGFEFLD